MMVNCPKCGFSQPQDQYCASCGVDMVLYRPAKKSFFRRLASNTVFQMTSVSLAIFIAFIVVRERNHKDHLARLELAQQSERFAQEREARRALLQGTTTASSEQVPAADAPIQPPVPTESTVAAAAPPPTVNPQAGAALAPPPTATTAAKTSTAAGAAATANPADSVRISFIEAHRPMINDLMSSASQVAIAGTISIGVVTGIQARLQATRSDTGWRPLESSAFQAMKSNQPNMIFKGVRDPASGANLGFTVQVIPGNEEEQGRFLQVDVLRVLRDAGAGADELTFPLPEGFTVPKGGAVVIAGVLPHRQFHEGEERIYGSSSILKVMSSENFRSGSTEAVILIETK